MSRVYALIAAGKVANIIEAVSWPNGIDITDLTPRPGIGWTYSGGVFAAPPAEPGPVVPPPLTHSPLMTQEAWLSRLDFETEYLPVLAARKTDIVVEGGFTRLDGSRNVDVRNPLVTILLGILVSRGLLAANRVAALTKLIPLSTPGAIHPITLAITPEPY